MHAVSIFSEESALETPRSSSTINERRCVCRHVTRLAVHLLLLSLRMARTSSGNPSNRGTKVEIFPSSKSSYRVV